MANKACNEVVTVANMPMTVFDMISAMQNKYADRVAFRYVEGKDTVVEKTYAQYVQDIRKATGYLQQELGEPKGKKIVILSRTNYEYGAVVFGTLMAGAVIVTLNQGKTWAELEYELGMVEPDLIFNDGIDYGYRAELEGFFSRCDWLLLRMDRRRWMRPGVLAVSTLMRWGKSLKRRLTR